MLYLRHHFSLHYLGKLMAKQSVALECLSYHATASHDDTERLRRDDIPSSEYYNLYRYVLRGWWEWGELLHLCQFEWRHTFLYISIASVNGDRYNWQLIELIMSFVFSYTFNDFPITDSDTCKATVRMFLDLNLVSQFHIPYPVIRNTFYSLIMEFQGFIL